MHSSKVTLHLDKSFPHDFDLSDEVQSLDFSFLYLLSGGFTIQIVSILTSMNRFYKFNPFRSSCKSDRLHIELTLTVKESLSHQIRPHQSRPLPRSLPQLKHSKIDNI